MVVCPLGWLPSLIPARCRQRIKRWTMGAAWGYLNFQTSEVSAKSTAKAYQYLERDDFDREEAPVNATGINDPDAEPAPPRPPILPKHSCANGVTSAMLWVWLSIFAFSLVGCAATALYCRYGGRNGVLWLVTRCAVVAAAFLTLADVLEWIPAGSGGWAWLGRGFVLAMGSLAACTVLLARSERFTPFVSWGLLAAAVLSASWSSQKFYLATTPSESELLSVGIKDGFERGTLSPYRAYTNEGRLVPLHEAVAPQKEHWLSTTKDSPAFAGRLIATGPLDPRYNCHGFAFTGGRFAVNGEWVDRILQDNRYRPVETPRADDLVIWRDSSGQPVHTGVVKAIGDDFVLIESKWGMSGRYLHVPEAQGYSRDFAYYRSPRLGHVLHIAAPGETPPVAASPGVIAQHSSDAKKPAGKTVDLRQLGAE
jgi:hypothetical protein